MGPQRTYADGEALPTRLPRSSSRIRMFLMVVNALFHIKKRPEFVQRLSGDQLAPRVLRAMCSRSRSDSAQSPPMQALVDPRPASP